MPSTREGKNAPDSPSNLTDTGYKSPEVPKDSPGEFDRGKFTMDDAKRGYKPGG